MTASDKSGTAGRDDQVTNTPSIPGSDSAPEPAEPPPITLGSYPWILIQKVEPLPDGTTKYYGIALDENDPPGIPISSGYLRYNHARSSKWIQVPIRITDKRKGFLEFTLPKGLKFTVDEIDVILSGPGYTSGVFPVCDFDDF